MKGQSGKTVRLTVAQAIVKYISAQYSVADGHRVRMVPAALGIFGHGNVAGLGQALDQYSDDLPFVHNHDFIGVHYSRESVSNDDSGPFLHDLCECLLHMPLALRIERTGGFVE